MNLFEQLKDHLKKLRNVSYVIFICASDKTKIPRKERMINNLKEFEQFIYF